MAFEYFELQETRGFADANGKVTASRVFRCFDDVTPLATPADVYAHFGVELPQIKEVFPGETAVYAVSYNIKHIPESRNAWEVTINYENTEPGTHLPNEEGYTEFSIDYAVEFRDLWRIDVPANKHVNGIPVLTDIAGTAVDMAGEPISVMTRMSDLVIKETVSSLTFAARSRVIRAARGRRNSAIFYGAPLGQVLYTGASASRIGLEKYSVTHKFRVDEFYHLIQTPERNQTKEVGCTRDGTGKLRATTVTYIQPFPGTYDFNSLSENF